MSEGATRRVVEQPDVAIVMPDGCRLSARLWLPDDATSDPVPTILEYLPYRKRDGTCARDALTHPWFAARGYACLRVDMRGSGDSEGLLFDEYSRQEQADALAVIEWIAAQPWCSGAVGMMGISWGGFNALQVAALRPPALRAIVTLCSTVDRYADDIHFKGGCLLNENLGWGATMLSYQSRPPDPALVGERWRGMWMERLENLPFFAADWLAHPTRDEYWRHGSVCEDYGAIEAATLAVGGWGDAYKNAVGALVDNLSCPAKGIVGPWVHKYPHFAVPEPRVGFLQVALEWWDRWLKGVPNGAEDRPRLRQYLLHSEPPRTGYAVRKGEWIAGGAEDETVLHLDDGTLGAEFATIDVPVASPAHCGAAAGEYCAIWLGPELPGDQRLDDAFSARFDRTLDRSLAIVGRPRVRLRLAPDRSKAPIAVRLNDVRPDGSSVRITYGVLNLANVEGEGAIDVSLELDATAYEVPAGHTLRVAISTAYWPLIWPAPTAATIRVLGGTLRLPTSRRRVPAEPFPEPDMATPWAVETLRPERHVRRTETDHVTGAVGLVIEDDFGMVRDHDHGLVSGSVARERWAIHPDDPLCASGDTHWTQELARDGWSVRTETRSRMWSDEARFHLTMSVEAFEGDERVYERTETRTLPRGSL